MRGDCWLEEFGPYQCEGVESAVLVRPNEARVACHIGGENGGQSAFDAFRGQSGAPQTARAEKIIGLRPILRVNARAGSPFGEESGVSRPTKRPNCHSRA